LVTLQMAGQGSISVSGMQVSPPTSSESVGRRGHVGWETAGCSLDLVYRATLAQPTWFVVTQSLEHIVMSLRTLPRSRSIFRGCAGCFTISDLDRSRSFLQFPPAIEPLPRRHHHLSLSRPLSRPHPTNNTNTLNMSTSAMPATAHHSAACCNVPPVVVKGYEEKGSYETVGGLKTCTFDCPLLSSQHSDNVQTSPVLVTPKKASS